MVRRTLLACILVLSFLMVAIAIDQAEASDGDASESDETDIIERIADYILSIETIDFVSESEVETILMKVSSAAFAFADYPEDDENKVVDIDGPISIGTGETFSINNGNSYRFSSDGSITIGPGGTLDLGSRFSIKGEPATIILQEGSILSLRGYQIPVEHYASCTIDGEMASNIQVTSKESQTSIEETIEGTITLDGYILLGSTRVDVDGDLLDMKAILTISLNPSSEIQNIREITEEVFSASNGALFFFDYRNVNLNMRSDVMDVSASLDNARLQLSSKLGSEGLELSYVDIRQVDIGINFNTSKMDRIILNMSNLITDNSDKDTLLIINNLKFQIVQLTSTLCDVTISSASISTDIGERIGIVFHRGNLHSYSGSFDMNLDFTEGSNPVFIDTRLSGTLRIDDNVTRSGNVQMGFKSDSHIIIGNDVNIGFAGDEPAHIDLGIVSLKAKIVSEQGYELTESKSSVYVGYTLRDKYTATPDSLNGVYHVEVVEGTYLLTLDDLVIEAKLGEVIELPIPEPKIGMTFIGWAIYSEVYKDEYCMPGADIKGRSVWSLDAYKEFLDGKRYIIISPTSAVSIKQSTMDTLKAYIEDDKVDSLDIMTVNGTISLTEECLKELDSPFTVCFMKLKKEDCPSRATVIKNGVLLTVHLWCNDIEVRHFSEEFVINYRYTDLGDGDNYVSASSMDIFGRLSSLETDFDIDGDHADVSFKAGVLPYFVLKSYEKKTYYSAKELIWISVLLIAFVGLALLLITKRWE